MQLTKEQIEAMYKATTMPINGNLYYVEQDDAGKLRFGAIQRVVTEKRKSIPLGKKPA